MLVFCLPSLEIKSNRIVKKIIIGKTVHISVEEVHLNAGHMPVPDIVIEPEVKKSKNLWKKKDSL